MTTTVLGAVVDAPGAAPVLQEIRLADLRDDEVLVRVAATGVCHTDLAWADGELYPGFPVVLGHETSGVVDSIGRSVTRVFPGDRVVLALTHHCGHCRYCEAGSPMLCARRSETPPRLSRAGEPLHQGFGTGGFAEAVVVRDVSCVKVPDDVPLATAAVVGCAVATGVGAVFNIAKVTPGSTIVVLGAGGIGVCVVMGAAVAGAERIVVVDPNEERRTRALQLGATDAVPPDEDLLREMTTDGFDYAFESVGRSEPMEQAVRLTRRGGTVTLIGAPSEDVVIRLPALEFVVSQRRLLGCLTGDVKPVTDYDTYFRLYQRGLLDLDALVTSRLPLSEIQNGFARGRRGEGIRTMMLTDLAG